MIYGRVALVDGLDQVRNDVKGLNLSDQVRDKRQVLRGYAWRGR